MDIVLGIGCIALGICAGIERARRSKLRKDIEYMADKLQQIMDEKTTERVHVMTEDTSLKKLLITTNELLDFNHDNQMKYRKAELSMKKMLSNISHDLKTPLTVVLGYLEMLDLKDKENEAIHKAYLRTQEVIALINKFFDLAKLESGDKEIAIEKVDIGEVCRVNLLDHYHALEEMGMEVHVDIPETPVLVLGNEKAIKRILNNLVTNAIKYGNAGKYLGLRVEVEEDKAVVQVIDHGKGIEERHKEDVFERLYTLEDSRSRNYQGSGLGLTITKELVELLGGEIHLDSKPYKETIFSFTLQRLKF